MGGYRDDREARQEQLKQLEREIAEAEARLAADRAFLRELATRVAAVEGRPPPPELAEKAAVTLESTAPAHAAAPTATAALPSRRGPLVMVGAACAAFALCAFALTSRKAAPPEPALAPMADIPGAPHKVDPLALYDRAEKLAAPESKLTEIDLFRVHPDGTLDLDGKSFSSYGSFRFVVSPAPPPVDPAALLGAPKPPEQPALVSCIYLGKDGLRATRDWDGFLSTQPDGCGMAYAAVPRPRCTTAQVWAAARAAGAPERAVARLTYTRFLVASPVWKFSIEGTKHEYTIGDPECRALTGHEANLR